MLHMRDRDFNTSTMLNNWPGCLIRLFNTRLSRSNILWTMSIRKRVSSSPQSLHNPYWNASSYELITPFHLLRAKRMHKYGANNSIIDAKNWRRDLVMMYKKVDAGKHEEGGIAITLMCEHKERIDGVCRLRGIGDRCEGV
jgi:hypothetical protein